MSFEEWLDKYAEGGIHLKGLTPKEYGQAIWAAMQLDIINLQKENKELIGENSAMASYLNDAKSLFVPDKRWDNFVKAYSMIKRAERIDANDFYDRSQEAAHYNWLDEKNENLEKHLEEAENALSYHADKSSWVLESHKYSIIINALNAGKNMYMMIGLKKKFKK